LMVIDAPICLNGTNTSEKAVDAPGKSAGIKTKKGSITALFSLQLKFHYSFIFAVKLFIPVKKLLSATKVLSTALVFSLIY